MEIKTCAACGQAFGCGRKDPECWCATLPPLPAERLKPAVDCYCPACLERQVAADDDDAPHDAGAGTAT